MPIPMPTWITPRGTGAALVIAAVFASGWYLGQPVQAARCEVPPRTVRYSDHLAADTVPGCGERPRLLAWLTGSLR